jgi:hypothetical protein
VLKVNNMPQVNLAKLKGYCPYHRNPAESRPEPLYIMAKLPPEVQAQTAVLPRNDPSRGL